ncbi:MAG TPA: SDR family oxidoreductase [Blastocatellia bacterium]|nr:SDR family oxidoreductase [Blastocatellia bacterium]
MSRNFQGKVALVTGASSGIGRASALAFAREGARVVVAARRSLQGEETAQMIIDGGGEAIFVKTDVSRANEVESLMKKIAGTYERLDCAFNNAGISSPFLSLTADLSEEEWDSVTNTNQKGIWLSMKYEIPLILKQGGGSIVNMASVLGLVGTSLGVGPYVASKHAIIGLTKAVALEYARQGLRVNAICPGFIQTELIEVVTNNAGAEDQLIAAHPVGRIGKAEEIAESVLWLCSDASSFVTGHSLVVDGGYVAQ